MVNSSWKISVDHQQFFATRSSPESISSYTITPNIFLLSVCDSGGGKTQAFNRYLEDPLNDIAKMKKISKLIYHEFTKSGLLKALKDGGGKLLWAADEFGELLVHALNPNDKEWKGFRGILNNFYSGRGISKAFAGRDTKCVLYLVDSASKESLLPLIQKHVPQTTTIYHDGLATYSKLHDLGYSHDVVFHNKQFVTPEGIHTNTIEGLWGLARQRFANMHGIKSPDRLAAHIDEFSFRQNYKNTDGMIWESWIEFSKMYYCWWRND